MASDEQIVAYAARTDVYARAGRLRDAFGTNDAPDNNEIGDFLENVAGLIDSILATHGIAVPTADATAAAALLGINADGALILALSATFPSDASDSPAARVIAEARARYDDAIKRLEDGTHPVVRLLAAGASGDANDFWTENPLYDSTTKMNEALTQSPSVLPGISKSERF